MNRKLELLAPGGDINSIKAAVLAGADAVYCGVDRFNARNRAANITLEILPEIIAFSHAHGCQLFLTLNIIIVESEISAFVRLLNKIVKFDLDGVILQDLGMIYLVSTHFSSLKIHASTQLTTHNAGQINFLSQMLATRVNLSRELSLGEISDLTNIAHRSGVEVEVFVHGSNCISFSGICYLSSVYGGNSGNRGRCSQQCRSKFYKTDKSNCYPLNLKDNSAFSNLKELYDAGVDSLKIEGRIKKYDYVYAVVSTWRKQIQFFYNTGLVGCDNEVLYTFFNRDLSNSFLRGEIGEDSYIDNPRDNSALNLARNLGSISEESVTAARDHINAQRLDIVEDVTSAIGKVDLEYFSSDVSRKEKNVKPVLLDKIKQNLEPTLAKLGVLISDICDIKLCMESSSEVYFKLPSCLKGTDVNYQKLFRENKDLIPWFDSVLIGNDFSDAVRFLNVVKPSLIVTSNSGIAFEAFKLGVDWIAGPNMNIVNSYSVHGVKELFNCSGSFLSNELSRTQLGAIKRPLGFKFMYSIYHPLEVMTSRACLFHQVTGCDKNKINETCISACSRSSVIKSEKNVKLHLVKNKGCYNKVFNDKNYLNTSVASDISGRFSTFLVDLQSVNTGTYIRVDKRHLLKLFEQHISSGGLLSEPLMESVQSTTCSQYKKGI